MKVFISWSGSLSKQVAEHIKIWVKCTLQATEPFVSFEDIDKGAFWFGEMGTKLAESDFGIVCLTKDNLTAPWILFEVGALSKGLTKSRVCTFLVNVPTSELLKPLSEFQATVPTKEDMLKLALSLNKGLSQPLEKEMVERTFSAFWPEFRKQYDAALEQHRSANRPQKRDQYDLVAELLEICRSMQQGVQQMTEVRKFERITSEAAAWRFAQAAYTKKLLAEVTVAVKQQANEIKEIEMGIDGTDATELEKKRLKDHLDVCRRRLSELEAHAMRLRQEMENQQLAQTPVALDYLRQSR